MLHARKSQPQFQMSIRRRLNILFGSLAAIDFIAVGVGGLALNRSLSQAPILDATRTQRTRAFKLAYLANTRENQIDLRNRAAITREMQDEIEEFETLLVQLRRGSTQLSLRPVTDGTALAQLEKIEDTWKIYRRSLENYLVATPNKENESLRVINNIAIFMANELEAMVDSLRREATTTAIQSQYLLLITLLLSLVAIASAFFVVSQITRHLTQVTHTAKLMALGDFNARAGLANQDEVGVLASTLNSMAEQIGSLLHGMEARGRQLEDTLANLAAIIDNLADGLLVTDTSGKITRFNPALLAMFGKGKIDLTGKDCRELVSTEVAQLVERTLRRSREVVTAEIELENNRVGQALATAILKSNLESSVQLDGESIGSVILIRDITAEKQIDRMKTDFISTVSHELRTPLTSVLGFAKIIKKKLEEGIFPLISTEDRKAQKTFKQIGENINIIVSEGDRLTSLINDVLDIAKMEAGKVEWEMEPISVVEVIERASAATAALFEINGLEMIKDVEAGLPSVLGDRDRLIQVLVNLISNSVKFTEKGSCTLRARQQGNEIIVNVIDTGIGIAPDDIDKVFEKFKQVGDTLTDKPKGTGLGLPICKQIVEHHGGRIWVESQKGVGSNFSFALPVNISTSSENAKIGIDILVKQLKESIVQATPSQTERQKTILVVDDDTNIRQLLRQELETEGYEVREAKDGMDAITQVKSARPDLIILDVMMPQINGFDVVAVLKNDPSTMSIPIVILSIVEDKERGYCLGIDRYFTKPVNTEGLLKEIGLLLSQGTSKKKVLVVDEDTSTARTLVEVLQAKGYSVVEASNGQECIEKALSIKPDMIIVDSMLSQQHNLVKTLRLEKGLENVFFLLLADAKTDE